MNLINVTPLQQSSHEMKSEVPVAKTEEKTPTEGAESQAVAGAASSEQKEGEGGICEL